MTSLTLRNISVTLDHTEVVSDISVDVQSGSCTGLIGPNGSGKTTLLRAVAGLVQHSGELLLDGVGEAKQSKRARSLQFAYAPQEPLLPPDMTVLELVLLGRAPHLGYFGNFSGRDTDVARQAVDRLDLSAFMHRRLSTLSGGERRRAALAQVMAQQTPILLLDEPTTALDVGHQQLVLELIDRLRREDGLTVIIALHDLTLASQYADQLVLLQRGEIVASGRPDDVLTADRLMEHYGANLEVVRLRDGLAVHPVRPDQTQEVAGFTGNPAR